MYFLFGILIVTFGLAEASLVIGSPELLMSDTCFVPPCVGSSVAAPVDRARHGSDVASKCKSQINWKYATLPRPFAIRFFTSLATVCDNQFS